MPQEARVNFLGQGEPRSLDPNRASFGSALDAAVVRQLFEPLLRFDAALVPQPAAAESYDVSPDGKSYTFHLRHDGRWSDGQPVTAAEFEYSWKRLLDPGLKAEYAALYVDAGILGADDYNSGRASTPDRVGVRALDDFTLEVDLSQPFGPLPDLAALWVGSPLRADVMALHPDDWAQDPSTLIGNGPFMLAEWAHHDHIGLVQNPEYTAHLGWPRPTLTRATVFMLTSGEADYSAFKNDERDWTLVPDAEVNAVLNDPDLARQSRQYGALATFWVQMNTARPPLNDSTVRRALARSMDRGAVVRDLASGISVPTTSVIPRGMPAFDDSVGRDLGFDPAAARALLAQAGSASGQALSKLAFSFPDTPDNRRRAHYFQAEWNQSLGVDIQLNGMDEAAYAAAINDRNYDLAFEGWAADYPDPQDWLNALFGCTGFYNKLNYCNPTFDQLVARADSGTSLADRLAQYAQAQTILAQDAPVIPLFVRGYLALVKPWVVSADGSPLLITPLDEYPGSLFLDQVQILPH